MPRESRDAKRRRAEEIAATLFEAHPDAHCELDHENAWQLLVATMLSAQSTDQTVNGVTPALFQRFPSAAELAKAAPQGVEKLVFQTGFYRQKTRSLLAMSRQLVSEHRGEVPDSIEALVKLHGVGRKTANVVLGNCFDTPGIVVDTHVGRLAGRMGLTREEDPVKVERDLMELIPRKDWTRFSHAMIFHGRRVCDARAPLCESCPIEPKCPFPRRRRPAQRKRSARRTRST
jgi:endonuclease-3